MVGLDVGIAGANQGERCLCFVALANYSDAPGFAHPGARILASPTVDNAVDVRNIATTDPHHDLPACAGCGRCCHQVVELVPGVDCVPEIFVVEHDGVRCLEQRGDGACIALDPVTRLCTIYENRPQTCRIFDRGGELCRRVLATARRI